MTSSHRRIALLAGASVSALGPSMPAFAEAGPADAVVATNASGTLMLSDPHRAGSGYASYIQSFTSLGVHHNQILDKATECEIPALAGSVLACRTSPITAWGQLDFQNRGVSGDREAGGHESDRWSALVGVDVSIGSAAIVGASVGRVTNRVDIDDHNALFNAKGWQAGAYAVFDPGPFYIKGLGTYSMFDGDSSREVDLRPFGGSTFGSPTGDPDLHMWTLGAHMGARVGIGFSAAATPFLNVDYTRVRLKGFSEANAPGFNLTVQDSTESRTTATAGLRLAGEIGGVVPQIDLGYRYQFGDRRSDFRAAFHNDEHCDFEIISQGERRGAFLAGLSLGGLVGRVDVRVSYQGLFGGDNTSHNGNFRIVTALGRGTEAAASALDYPLPPPPPESVIEQAPLPPPPPAPAPAEGERD